MMNVVPYHGVVATGGVGLSDGEYQTCVKRPSQQSTYVLPFSIVRQVGSALCAVVPLARARMRILH